MHQAVFHISGEGPYERATAASTTGIELWCNDHCDLLHVVGDEDGLVLDHIRDEVGVRQRVADGDDRLLVTEACLKQHGDDYVEQYLAAHDCLTLPPLRYENGAKVVRVLALDTRSLTEFYRDITDDYTVTVESKREVSGVRVDEPLLSLDALLPSLSERQREVFTTAHRQGYFEMPRETTTEAVAESAGIERRTAEHHLRRAEQKLADALVEYL
ncbi:helix-turn-helix domain-containing protein [Halorarius halobius]|uniref:helix-turn-helix domain-containing protein n=1 Tax=Halorarius halobius TaxID=2962671 RepID=UPI0020CDAF42|nr:helix-turn-helix domain-containing protein [Halorarius halobius]